MPVTHTPNINFEDYKKLYQQSISNPEVFWSEQASKHISWQQPFQQAITHDQDDFSAG